MDHVTINAATAAAIMRRMAERGVTHADMAAAIGVSEKSLTRRFVSDTTFKLPELAKIANALGCTWSELLPPIDTDVA